MKYMLIIISFMMLYVVATPSWQEKQDAKAKYHPPIVYVDYADEGVTGCGVKGQGAEGLAEAAEYLLNHPTELAEAQAAALEDCVKPIPRSRS